MCTMKISRPFLYTRPKDVPRTHHEEEYPERSFFILEEIQRRSFFILGAIV